MDFDKIARGVRAGSQTSRYVIETPNNINPSEQKKNWKKDHLMMLKNQSWEKLQGNEIWEVLVRTLIAISY